MKLLQPHPDPRLQRWWNIAQFGLLLLPMSPLLAGISLLFALGGTWKNYPQQIHQSKLNQGFAFLAALLVISATLAADKIAALLGLFNFLPFFAFFAAFTVLIQTPQQLRRMAWILLIGSIPVVIIGFGQLFWGWTGPVKLGLIIDWPIAPMGTPPGRMASVFAYANVLASYFLIPFILGLGLWIEETQALKQRQQIPTQQEMVRDPRDPRIVRVVNLNSTEDASQMWMRWLFLTLAILGNGIALILTNSRNGWAIALLALIAFALYQGWRWILGVVAAVVTAILGAAFGPNPIQGWLRAIVPAYFWARINDDLFPDRHIGTLRITQWKFAGNMTLEKPLTGWGLRSFPPLYEAQTQVYMGHPHNLFLMLSAETGIPATLLLSGIVAWVLAQGIFLLRNWSIDSVGESKVIPFFQDRLIFFSYLITFTGCILFHVLDVPLFDSRINILGWLLLAAISGLVARFRQAYSLRESPANSILHDNFG